jgi:hypothetical protein
MRDSLLLRTCGGHPLLWKQGRYHPRTTLRDIRIPRTSSEQSKTSNNSSNWPRPMTKDMPPLQG